MELLLVDYEHIGCTSHCSIGTSYRDTNLQSAELALIIHFPSSSDYDTQDLHLYRETQPQLTDPIEIDENDDGSISTHPSMPDLLWTTKSKQRV